MSYNKYAVINFFFSVVSISTTIVKGVALDYVLISRRNSYRAGTRYYMRGVDSYGNAANNVETEQIVFCNNNKFSFVQVISGKFFFHISF